MSVYMYYVDGLLIDTGQHNMQPTVTKLLSAKKVNGVLLTHHHEDHSGNAAAISSFHHTKVIGHPETAKLMKSGFRIRPYQHYVWGKAGKTAVDPINAYYETERFRFKPIHTPGHCSDHTVYLEENKGWLFSGDLYLGERIKFFRADEQMADQIDSFLLEAQSFLSLYRYVPEWQVRLDPPEKEETGHPGRRVRMEIQ
ncbi:MBL fold metallo-hydrolase [Thermodesulfobacteriota bacterium]